jgi:hypothetical protein
MVTIVHHGGQSTKHYHNHFSTDMMTESVKRLLRKKHGALYAQAYRLTLSAAAIIRMILLVIFYPLALVQNRGSECLGAFGKWFSVLRWGLGLEAWIYKYGSPEQSQGRGRFGDGKYSG